VNHLGEPHQKVTQGIRILYENGTELRRWAMIQSLSVITRELPVTIGHRTIT
jgi:hypothetical protein